MALEWADFPSGQPGVYGSGVAATTRMLDGTPWSFVSGAGPTSGLVADPDPNVPAGSVAYRVRRGIGDPIDTPGVALVLRNPTNGVLWCAARVWYPEFSGNDTEVIFAFTAVSNGQTGYQLRKELNGALSVWRRVGGTEDMVATSTVPLLTTNAWIHLSFQVDTVSGDYSVQREGVTVMTGNDVGAINTTIGFFKSYTSNIQNNGFFLKDFCIGNGAGSVNNGHPGTVIVNDLLPNADVTLGGWTTSTGSTGFNLLNEVPPDDARFISADDSPPAPSEFQFTDLPADVTSVRALISIVRARKVDGGDGNLQVSLSPNGTNYSVGADRPITSAATYWFDVSEASPATSGNWTPGEVDSVRMRINRTA